MSGALPPTDTHDVAHSQQGKHTMNNSELHSPSSPIPMPPIHRTTNALCFPNTIDHICGFDRSLNQGSVDYGQHSPFDNNMILSKLRIPGSMVGTAQSSPNSQMKCKALVACQQLPHAHSALSTVEFALPSSTLELSFLQDRVDTKDSLDSQFNVATAVRKLDLPTNCETASLWQNFARWKAADEQGPKIYAVDISQDPTTPTVDEFPLRENGLDDSPKIDQVAVWSIHDLDFDLCFGNASTFSVEGSKQEDKTLLTRKQSAHKAVANDLDPRQGDEV
ncbi:hypothetical protein H2198_000214 [Neophaeococcomyces mojaviensis]|uniref:Uncharacterized protein n=1 Tax=Neophaeococcomyces mojaviensis TaxID=3383035 RepID=A0ACC3AKK7_9EURO|nr:hypothetical protein H2198_000214 [Knufia sp. JES_112]